MITLHVGQGLERLNNLTPISEVSPTRAHVSKSRGTSTSFASRTHYQETLAKMSNRGGARAADGNGDAAFNLDQQQVSHPVVDSSQWRNYMLPHILSSVLTAIRLRNAEIRSCSISKLS